MEKLLVIFVLVFAFSCKSDSEGEVVLEPGVLADYIELNNNLELGDNVVACAGGRENGLLGDVNAPTDVFFYPIEGATDFRYFEAQNVADSADFSKYIRKDLVDEPVFNGYLRKFNNTPFAEDRMGVVTFRTADSFHVSTPIRQKTNSKPTEVNFDLAEVFENELTPSFTWKDGLIDENVIYFQVISDAENNFISGTYTLEKQFTFYDLSNVVFNITDTSFLPQLNPNENYTFTLMGISEDNWVNFFAEKEFSTN